LSVIFLNFFALPRGRYLSTTLMEDLRDLEARLLRALWTI
jgi:hypothetical protein